jgi:heme/copper-type cytochrome/quinol oxidase subunit 2
MRLIVLTICGSVAVLVFLAMLAAIARYRKQSLSGTSQTNRFAALAEYLWAMIPWLMMVSCAIPAVRQVIASAREPFEAAPVAAVLGAAYRDPSQKRQ